MATLWNKGTSATEAVERFTVGNDRELDLRLARYDVQGSLAHIRMLAHIGLLGDDELAVLTAALERIADSIEAGTFVLEDDVELGANACVDRATMGATIVHRGAKIDNLVQVGHNVEVGSHTVLCAQVGIAGSTKVGEWCTFTGQVGVAGHLTIADRTTLGAQTGLPGSVRKPGQTLIGYPAMDPKVFARSSAVFKTLPEMAAQLRELQKEVEELRAKIKEK